MRWPCALIALFGCSDDGAPTERIPAHEDAGPDGARAPDAATASDGGAVDAAALDATASRDARVVCDLQCRADQFCLLRELPCLVAPCPVEPYCKDTVPSCNACGPTQECVIWECFGNGGCSPQHTCEPVARDR